LFENVFFWSISRDKCFNQCKRKYYYNHYGFVNGWDKKESQEIQEIYLLKKLQTIPQWIGKLVSDKINAILGEMKKNEIPNLNVALSELDAEFNSKYQESKEKRFRQAPSKFLGLQDHEYDNLIDEEYLSEQLKFSKTCLTNFFESAIFTEISSLDKSSWIFPKDYEPKGFPSFIFENSKLYAVFKFGIKNSDNLILYDWTTSQSEEDTDFSNVFKYGTILKFFVEKEGLTPLQIRVKKIFLKDGSTKVIMFSNTDLEKIEKYITKSILHMKELLDDIPDNKASEEKFSKTNNESNCAYCNYKKKCFQDANSVFRGYGVN